MNFTPVLDRKELILFSIIAVIMDEITNTIYPIELVIQFLLDVFQMTSSVII